MLTAQYPAAVDDFEVQFGRYSLKDLARIGTPALAGWAAANIPGLVAGAAAGVGLAELEPGDRNLDSLALDYLDFRTGSSGLETTGELRDDVVVLDDGTVLGMVEVESIDLEMASDAEWMVNRDVLSTLYRQIEYPLQVHSRKHPVDLSEYDGGSDGAVATDHYVVVHDRPGGDLDSILPWRESSSKTVDERIDDVCERCDSIREQLSAGGLSADHLAGQELRDALDTFVYPEVELENRGYDVGGRQEKQYHRLLAITEYPEELGVGFLSDVLNKDVPGFVDVVQAVEPVSDRKRRKLRRVAARLKAEHAATPDPFRGSGIGRKLEDLMDMIEAESLGGERLVEHAAYIVARGRTRDEAGETIEEISRLLRRNQVEFREPWLRTHRAVRTDSPFTGDPLGMSVVMPSRSAASNFSFSTHDKIEPGGIVWGIDSRNGQPVVLDRYSWEAGDGARMGKKGSGKSFSAKLMLLRAWLQYNDLQIRILDPKQEYGRIKDVLGGSGVVLDNVDLQTIDLDDTVVRYTVADRSNDNTELLTGAMQHIYRDVSQDREKAIVLVDEAWHLLNDSTGREVLGKLVREGRDINACVELVTQNASDFTRSQEGRDILKNLNFYMFFKHQDVNTGVSEFFNLSTRQAQALRKLRTGNEVSFSESIIRGPVNTKLRIKATEQEFEIIIEGGDS